jgi:hypothetical protein
MNRSSNIIGIVLGFIFFIAAEGYAANHYVRQGASGNGSDWSNAYSQLPETLVRGDTYYIADGTYPGYNFNDSESGSTNIYIRKATTSAHGTATGWSNSYGDGQAAFSSGLTFSSNYYEFDGVLRSTKTSGYGFKITTSTKGVTVTGRSHITIKYTDIQGHGDDGDGPNNDLVYASQAASYITISYCYLHDSGRTLLLSRGGTNWILEYSYLYHNESVPAEHSEAWSCGTTSNVYVRYNVFDTTEGTAVIATLDNPSGPSNWYIYGNTFLDYPTTANGLIACDSESTWSNVYFYNNTVVRSDCRFDMMGGGSGWSIRNNIFYSCVAGPSFRGTHDYNAYSSSLGETHGQSNISTSTFKNYAGEDFALAVPTDAGDSSIGTTYSNDPVGNTRGGDGVWDRGAFEYAIGGGGSGTTVENPSNLRVINNQ